MATDLRRRSLVCLLVAVATLGVPALAVAESSPTQPISQAATSFSFTPDVREIAQITDVLPILEQLEVELDTIGSLKPHTIEMIEKKERILYLRQKTIQSLNTALFEINATNCKIDTASAELADAEAVLNEHRARTIRRNSMINFVSGGVTKMVGYSLAMAPVSLFTTNLLEVADGGIQSTLSLLTIRDQHAEKQMLKDVPPFLTVLFEQRATTSEYPATVWKYLNNSQPGEKITRRQALLEDWKRNGILKRAPHTVLSANGQIGISQAQAGKWIADHSAMLSDLKSVISSMNNGLMMLSEMVKHSYDSDSLF